MHRVRFQKLRKPCNFKGILICQNTIFAILFLFTTIPVNSPTLLI